MHAWFDVAVTGDEAWLLQVEDPQTPGQLAVEMVRARKKDDEVSRKELLEKLLSMREKSSSGLVEYLAACVSMGKNKWMRLYEESHAKGCTEGSFQLAPEGVWGGGTLLPGAARCMCPTL